MKPFLPLLVFSVLFLSLINSARAQTCYIQLEDMTGYNIPTNDLDALDAAACAIMAVMPAEFQDQFKVYDFGFYLHNESQGAVQAVLEEQEQGIAMPYYLLFGRQSDADGLFKKFWIKLKLPDTDIFECADQAMLDNLLGEITTFTQIAFDNTGAQPSAFPTAEQAGMNRLKNYIVKQVDCCIPGNFRASNTCGSCMTVEDLSTVLAFNEYKSTAIEGIESFSPTYYSDDFFEKNADVTVTDDNGDLIDLDEMLSDLTTNLNNHFTPIKISLSYYDANSCPELMNFSGDKRGERFMYIDVVVVDNGETDRKIYSKMYSGLNEEEAVTPTLYILTVGSLGFSNSTLKSKVQSFIGLGGCTANIVVGSKVAYPEYKKNDKLVIIGKDRNEIYNVAMGSLGEVYCNYFGSGFWWEIQSWITQPRDWEITDGTRWRSAVVDLSSIDPDLLRAGSLSEGAAFIIYHSLGHMTRRGHSGTFNPDGFMATGSGIEHILGTKELSNNRSPEKWNLYDNLPDLINDPDMKFNALARKFKDKICDLF